MENEAEAAMICVDNSTSMMSRLFQEQVDAIRFYCTEKLNANPKKVVGIVSTSGYYCRVAVQPTRDISTIMAVVYNLPKTSLLILLDAVVFAKQVWCTDLNKDLKKRIVVFAGGYIYGYTDKSKSVGLLLKEWDIACDAVNFGYQASHKKELFEALVAVAQNNGNSHNLHAKDDIIVSQALSRFPLLVLLISQLLDSFWEDHDRNNPAPEIAQAEYAC
ncbi:dehydroascorbate reductase 2 [Tanacetum coccineum]